MINRIIYRQRKKAEPKMGCGFLFCINEAYARELCLVRFELFVWPLFHFHRLVHIVDQSLRMVLQNMQRSVFPSIFVLLPHSGQSMTVAEVESIPAQK